jgi:hypothetical protein
MKKSGTADKANQEKSNQLRASQSKSTSRNVSGSRSESNIDSRRKFLKKTAIMGGGAGLLGLGSTGLIRAAAVASGPAQDYFWAEDSNGNYGLYDTSGTEMLSVTNEGLVDLFYPNTSTEPGPDLRVNFSNSLFGSGIPRIAFAMKWGSILTSDSVFVIAPQDWIVVYLMVGHLKITGYSGTSPITFTVNYTDPPGHNFTATLCSVTPSENIQNTDFSPVCEDIRPGSKITVSVNLGAGDTVTNMQGYLTFLEVDRRPGGDYNTYVPKGLDKGDANLQLAGFSKGEWSGQLQ